MDHDISFKNSYSYSVEIIEMNQGLKLSKIYFSVKIVSALISGTIEIHNQVYGSENRKRALEVKIENGSAPVPQKIMNLVNKVMNDMKLSSKDRSLIKPFLTQSLQLKIFGYSKAKPGAFLGLPEHLYFENYPYIVPVNFTFMVQGMDHRPTAPVSQAFKHGAFLSENAKKFAIAREIYESRHAHIFIIAFAPAIVYSLIFSILLLAQRFEKSIIKRHPVGYCAAVLPLELISFILLRNKLRVHSEGKADFEAANLGLSYIQGGIEYYEKMMDKHKALKSLSEDFPFDNDGDFTQSMFRPQHMPVLKRIRYLNELKKAEQTKSKKPAVWSYVFSLERNKTDIQSIESGKE